ncbi:hypothetical protein B0J12DRAFT_730217 [Macrophomina phaseolina]|uniref:Uncharacterized protein n=1 Tax=Macrophomina phaseolina TaxID=35725 RepID=A0ABQ8G4V2_9PEZI|nr:hypothetical protein B0J12DRAFT_730217 [Macrophomina phaseolina]
MRSSLPVIALLVAAAAAAPAPQPQAPGWINAPQFNNFNNDPLLSRFSGDPQLSNTLQNLFRNYPNLRVQLQNNPAALNQLFYDQNLRNTLVNDPNIFNSYNALVQALGLDSQPYTGNGRPNVNQYVNFGNPNDPVWPPTRRQKRSAEPEPADGAAPDSKDVDNYGYIPPYNGLQSYGGSPPYGGNYPFNLNWQRVASDNDADGNEQGRGDLLAVLRQINPQAWGSANDEQLKQALRNLGPNWQWRVQSDPYGFLNQLAYTWPPQVNWKREADPVPEAAE